MNTDRNDETPARKPSPDAEDSARHANSRQPSASPARAVRPENNNHATEAPLPYDENPPLPDEHAPNAADDGWDPVWDYNARTYRFYNRHTGHSQWENPRVPEATGYSVPEATGYTHASYDRTSTGSAPALTTSSGAPGTSSPPKRIWGGYNPAIHGSYDPNADYAREATKEEEEAEKAAAAAQAAAAGLPNPNAQDYTASAQFNRFTGKFQQEGVGPEMHNDENKSKRQMNAFFDVEAAANSHDGRSLKAERRGKTLSKKELKAYKDKRRQTKEHKRRAWLLD